jgi:hypothetical protein
MSAEVSRTRSTTVIRLPSSTRAVADLAARPNCRLGSGGWPALGWRQGRRYFLGSSFFSAGGGVVAPLGAFLEASSPHAEKRKATAAIESSDLIMKRVLRNPAEILAPPKRGFLQAARLRYCFFGSVLPLPGVLPLPDVDGLVGEVDGLVGEVDGLGVLPPLPASSRRHFSRSAPVRATHFAGTSAEEPLAVPLVPLDGLSL